MEGRLFVVSGPSGTGKGTLCKALLQRMNFELSVSMTTRRQREGEEEGKSYFFVTKEVFEKRIREGGFLERAQVYGNDYGTPKDFVLQKLHAGKDVMLEIDIQGALQIKESYPKAVFIFILPPSMKELRKRITGRKSESEESLHIRIGEALKEIAYIDKYDYCIINDVIDEAVLRMESIVRAEHCKVSKDIYALIEKYKEEI